MWVFLVAAVVLLLAGTVLSYPLLVPALEAYLSSEAESTPFNERDALLEALSELELEYRAGKVSEADYSREKARLQREYLAVASTAR